MKILIIDDDINILLFLKKSLKAENFVVDTANDGEKGSFLARTNEYDLIILDNILPKKDGIIVCEEIREKNVNTPILMLSVKADTQSKVKLLNSGADDYLVKPFSFEELLARIKALIRRPARIEKDEMTIGDLSIDMKNQTVKQGAKEIYLTRKEFILLEYLAKNNGSVVSRGKIIEHVWDMDIDPFSNTIEMHILSLRKKLSGKGKKKIIHTVTGRGYRFSLE